MRRVAVESRMRHAKHFAAVTAWQRHHDQHHTAPNPSIGGEHPREGATRYWSVFRQHIRHLRTVKERGIQRLWLGAFQHALSSRPASANCRRIISGPYLKPS